MSRRLLVIAACAAVLGLAGSRADAAPRFTNNANGTVTDNATGLIWQRQDDGVTRWWKPALAYCEALVLGGSDAWRLPNVKELYSTADTAVTTPAIDAAAFPNTKPSGYWTSTSRAGSPNFAWYVFYAKGQVSTDMKTNPNYVRCVR